MNVSKIRKNFPYLERKFKGKPLVYFDNASTTQKPKAVIDALVDTYQSHYANIHRGVYDLSVEATQLYEEVREKVKKLVGADGDFEVIFTKNTTESLNLLAYSLEIFFKNDDEILLSEMEHHSNIVPWQLLAQRLASCGKRLVIKYIPITADGRLDLSGLDKLVTKKTKILSLTLMSNVLGTINPVWEIFRRAKKICPSLIAICDAAQAAARMKIDVGTLGCDFLAFSAHKMYGPAGVGVLWGRKDLLEAMPPFMGGGDMILSVDFDKTTFNEVPFKFEAGTPSIADVIAFGEAIKFIEQFSYEQIRKHEMELTVYALEKLSEIPQVTIYGPHNAHSGSETIRAGVISFNVGSVHPHDVASILSDEGVAIRSGHHCAQPLMKVLGINAACRVSFGIYNTKEEVDRLISGLKKVKQVFRLSGNKVIGKRTVQRSLPDSLTA